MIARDELAARFAVEAYGALHGVDTVFTNGIAYDVVARNAAKMTDALLSALAVPPAAPAPSPYVPKVGDVVLDPRDLHFLVHCVRDGVTYAHPQFSDGYTLSFKTNCSAPINASAVRFDRPATASERAAAGLPEDRSVDEATTPPAATPAYPVDAAGRPLWVKVDPAKSYPPFVRKVLRWDGVHPVVARAEGPDVLRDSSRDTRSLEHVAWEPCAAPTDAVTPAAALTEEDIGSLKADIRAALSAWRKDMADHRLADEVAADAAAAWFSRRGGAK